MSSQQPPESEFPDHAGVAFHPPLLLGVLILAGFLARWITPLTFLPDRLSSLIGPVVTVLALGLFVWAVGTMRRENASIPTGEPSDVLVTTGPFGFSRNPIYLSMLLLQLGICLWTNSIWFLALANVFILSMGWGVISHEEAYMERKFGAEYLSYKDRVERWF